MSLTAGQLLRNIVDLFYLHIGVFLVYKTFKINQNSSCLVYNNRIEAEEHCASLASPFMNVFLTRHLNVSAPCPTCVHHVIIQHHIVLITFFNLD